MINILLPLMLLGPSQEMTASWYGEPFHGNVTASGDTFDMHEMTAASPDLPFGTVLLLESDGRTAVTTVTDRGPFAVDSNGIAIWPLEPHPVRDLDLSFGAMKMLGGVLDGTIDATVWRLR
jgi:rare lipoprotein A